MPKHTNSLLSSNQPAWLDQNPCCWTIGQCADKRHEDHAVFQLVRVEAHGPGKGGVDKAKLSFPTAKSSSGLWGFAGSIRSLLSRGRRPKWAAFLPANETSTLFVCQRLAEGVCKPLLRVIVVPDKMNRLSSAQFEAVRAVISFIKRDGVLSDMVALSSGLGGDIKAQGGEVTLGASFVRVTRVEIARRHVAIFKRKNAQGSLPLILSSQEAVVLMHRDGSLLYSSPAARNLLKKPGLHPVPAQQDEKLMPAAHCVVSRHRYPQKIPASG